MMKHVCDVCDKWLEDGGVKIAIKCAWGFGEDRDKLQEKSKTFTLCYQCYVTLPPWFCGVFAK